MSCYGCYENLSTPFYHMDPGGCLCPLRQENALASSAIDSQTDSQEFCIVEVQPIGCAVCITQEYFNRTSGCVRRASPGMLRCQDHQSQCAYCTSPDCENNSLVCERCSYSAEGNAAISEALLGQFRICLYDRDMSPSEGWTCGCPRCMQVTATFYTALNATDKEFEALLLSEVITD